MIEVTANKSSIDISVDGDVVTLLAETCCIVMAVCKSISEEFGLEGDEEDDYAKDLQSLVAQSLLRKAEHEKNC